MTTKPIITAPKTTNSKLNRKAHMDRIRSSLKNVPLLHQNVDLVAKSSSSVTPLETPSFNSRLSESPDSSPEKVFVENYELFDEKYELCEKLGEGTNGVVRKCRKRQSGEEFAVKTFTF